MLILMDDSEFNKQQDRSAKRGKRPRRRKSFLDRLQRTKDAKKNKFFERMWRQLKAEFPVGSVIAGTGRCSLKDKTEGHSEKYQTATVAEFCGSHNLPLVTAAESGIEFSDYPGSGYDLDRLGFQTLLADCRSGRVTHVVATTPDRYGRCPEVFEEMLHVHAEYGTIFMAMHPNNPAENIRRQKEFRKANGYACGRTAYGHNLDRHTGLLAKDQDEWRLWERVTALRATNPLTGRKPEWSAVVMQINREGFRNKSGQLWKLSSLKEFCKRLQMRFPQVAGKESPGHFAGPEKEGAHV